MHVFNLKLDDTGDIAFDSQNNLALVEGLEEEVQCLRCLVATNQGEWFLNLLEGLAYKYLQTKNPSDERIKAELTSTLHQESRVQEVVEIGIKRDNSSRVLEINFIVKMTSGNIIERRVVQ